jgi:transcriptional regulator with XRE-family HTH domain
MLGQRLLLLRRGMGLSQAELAAHLHISASAVGMYEQGRREPSLKGIVELARVFGVSVDYLLTGRPHCSGDERAVSALLTKAAESSCNRGAGRLTREELTVLFSAMLLEA